MAIIATYISLGIPLSQGTARARVCVLINLWISPELTVIDQYVEWDFLHLEPLDELLNGPHGRQVTIQKFHWRKTKMRGYPPIYHRC